MSRQLSVANRADLFWARDSVAKGVKAISIANMDLRLSSTDKLPDICSQIEKELDKNSEITACYLDMVREPERFGTEYTGGDLLHPIIGAVPQSDGCYAVFFAANETMADLFRWAFSSIQFKMGTDVDCRRAHAVIGLLCGYSPLAIEGFLEQPDKLVDDKLV